MATDETTSPTLDLDEVLTPTVTVRIGGIAYDMELEMPLRRHNAYLQAFKRIDALENLDLTTELDEKEYEQRKHELVKALIPKMPDDVIAGLTLRQVTYISSLFQRVAIDQQAEAMATAQKILDALVNANSLSASNGHTPAATRRRG